jgi:acyl-coenzyme A synthetase/AMP-(fatty) acid ligase
MTFLGKIAAIEQSRTAIITKDAAFSYGDLVSRARAYGSVGAGAHVFINLRDLVSAVIALLVLDGIADEIAITSAWQERDTVRPLLGRSTFDAVICDAPADFADTVKDVQLFEGLAQFDTGYRPGERVRVSAPVQTRWLLTTSGTTGQPKMVSHSLSSLTRSTRTDPKRGDVQIWGMLYDYSRFAGLQVVLQSLLSGATLVAPEYDATLDEKIQMFRQHGCTHLSATPTMWRKILMTPGSQELPLRQITLGGEIADDAIINSLAKVFPDSRISHIFASTEAGVGFSVTDRRAGFPEAFLVDPPMGIGLRIESGLFFVRNEEVAETYLGEEGRLSEDGWVNTGDMVEVRDGRVYFKGRASGVINVGGDKVHPEEIEAVLLEHPFVQSARVYAKSNPIMGALVAADVALDRAHEDPAAVKLELLRFLKEKLDKHKVPAMLKIVDGFDVNVAGKLQRKN